jgi:hypothetical protein
MGETIPEFVAELFCLGRSDLVKQTHKETQEFTVFSLQANYTCRAAITCRWSYCQLLRVEDVAWSAHRIPMAAHLGFSRPVQLHFHSSASLVIHMGLSAPCSRTITSQKIWNRTWDIWICSQELWPLDHKGCPELVQLMKLYARLYLLEHGFVQRLTLAA